LLLSWALLIISTCFVVATSRSSVSATPHSPCNATQAECTVRNHHRPGSRSGPSKMGRKFKPSSSIIPHANCIMPDVSAHLKSAARQSFCECNLILSIALVRHLPGGRGRREKVSELCPRSSARSTTKRDLEYRPRPLLNDPPNPSESPVSALPTSPRP
jgi:hypothetical protein